MDELIKLENINKFKFNNEHYLKINNNNFVFICVGFNSEIDCLYEYPYILKKLIIDHFELLSSLSEFELSIKIIALGGVICRDQKLKKLIVDNYINTKRWLQII